MSLKEDDIVLCTVSRIEGANVFVDIENNGQGTIAMSEIAAGRIRNLREYVTLNKKIACKVLKIENGRAELSLRRVTAKERDEIMEKYKQEKTANTVLSNSLKNNPSALKKILEKYTAHDFLNAAKSDSSILNKFVSKDESELLQKVIADKKEKEKKSRRIFTLNTDSPYGLTDIKKILEFPNVHISYLGSSKFTIEASGKEFKEANQHIDTAIASIQKKAKELKANFGIKAE